MAKEIVVPALGESISDATIGRWLRRVGDVVKLDEPLVELETDKVTLEINAPTTGRLAEMRSAVGERVTAGKIIGVISNDLSEPVSASPMEEAAPSSTPRSSSPFITVASHGTPEPVSTSTTPVSFESSLSPNQPVLSDHAPVDVGSSYLSPQSAALLAPEIPAEPLILSETPPDENSKAKRFSMSIQRLSELAGFGPFKKAPEKESSKPSTPPSTSPELKESTPQELTLSSDHVSPAVRKMLEERGLSPAQMARGSGKEGRLIKEDVLRLDSDSSDAASVNDVPTHSLAIETGAAVVTSPSEPRPSSAARVISVGPAVPMPKPTISSSFQPTVTPHVVSTLVPPQPIKETSMPQQNHSMAQSPSAALPQPQPEAAPAPLAQDGPMKPATPDVPQATTQPPETLTGTGAGQAVTSLKSGAGEEAVALLEERVKMTRLRQRVAERLKEAQNTAAMLTTFNEIDMSALMGARDAYKDAFQNRFGIKLGFMSFFVKATVAALKEFPVLNAEIDGDEIIYKRHYDIGVAVSAPQGLVVPVIRDADHLSFSDIEQTIADFGQKARTNKLSVNELIGGTFTITNGGIFGSLMSTPIINPPQSAILGMHKIAKRAVVVNDKIEIRPMMYVALTYDHRIIDGREAVTFLVRLKECIEDPNRLLLGV